VITTVAGGGSAVEDNVPATSAYLVAPEGVAVDAAGRLYIADTYRYQVRRVTNGIITTIAGNGTLGSSGDNGRAVNGQLYYPNSVAVDTSGNNLYVSEGNYEGFSSNRVRRIVSGVITTAAGDGSSSGPLGDNGPATSAHLTEPYGVALDSAGNLYISDAGNNRVRKVVNGVISTVAGNGTRGYGGDGGSATVAEIDDVSGLAVDSAGAVYIADTANHRVRKVANGIITTIAGTGIAGFSGDNGPALGAQVNTPVGIAIDSAGNLYIAESGNSRIRKVTNGIIATVAGNGVYGYSGDNGPATSAQIRPNSVAVDALGNIYIAETTRIRKVSNGVIATIAGNGTLGFSGDGGPATSAQLTDVSGVAADGAGNLYIADFYNHRIRVLVPDASCSYSVIPTSLQVPASGAGLTVNIQTSASCSWTIIGLPDWITVSGAASNTGSSTVTLAVASNSGAPRSAQISVAGIAVMFNQASNLLLVSAGGVVNDASYMSPVAPGSIAAIFGNFLLPAPLQATSLPIPTSLGGLSFQFTGTPSIPLFYVNFGQVNGQVPWELAGQSQTTITATQKGQTSSPQTVTLASYAPGIFAANAEGAGQGAILDSNYHLVDVTNPATAGSTLLQIYCTGLGPVTNQPATGVPAPSNPLSQTTTQPMVTIGGVTANVQFSGLAPGFVGGYQVNALVPLTSAKGNAVPVVISIGGVQSNTVTIAVH